MWSRDECGRELLCRLGVTSESAPWRAVAALAMGQLVAWGTLYYAYTVIAPSIASDLDVSQTVVGAAFTLTLLLAGGLAPAVGRRLDRVGAAPVLLAAAMAGAIALGTIAVARGLVLLLFAFVLLGFAQACGLYETAFRAIVAWFPDPHERTRGLVAVTAVGALASTAFVPLTAALVERNGWRVATAVLATTHLVAGLVTHAVVARRAAARSVGRLPDESRSEPAVSSLPRGVMSLAAVLAVHAWASSAVAVGLLWWFVEEGVPLAESAAIVGVAGASQLAGRLVLAVVPDRMGSRQRLPLLLMAQAGALSAIGVGDRRIAIACVVLYGAANGMVTVDRANIVVERYGRRWFGKVSGRIGAIAAVGRATAPMTVAVLHGVMSYRAVFGWVSAMLFAAAMLLWSDARDRPASAVEADAA